jgi:hypothetical protein
MVRTGIRLTDNLHVLADGEEPRKVSYVDILNELDPRNSIGPDRVKERELIARWLETNEPSPVVERSLRRNGFGDLLDDPQT